MEFHNFYTLTASLWEIKLLIGCIAGIYGSLLGSFATALIYRLHFDQPGIFIGRSTCPHCKTKLKARNLIPIISWSLQKGSCQYCSQPIPFFYPLIEITFAITFAVFTVKFWNTPILIPMMISVFFCLVLFFYDTFYQEVDMRIIIPAIILAFVWSFFRETDFKEYLLAGGLGFSFYAIQYYGSRGKWVGDGDMFLGAFIGLLLGLKMTFLAFFIAYIIGSFVAIYLLIFKKANRKTALPMGAFLMPSTLIMLYLGDQIWNWYWTSFIASNQLF